MKQRKRTLLRLFAAAMALLCTLTPLQKVQAAGEGDLLTTAKTVYLAGDINGDGTVTYYDPVYLLLHTLFGEVRYPLNAAPADIDGNGTVNLEDAVYLLLHALFGSDYYPFHDAGSSEAVSLYDLMTGGATVYNAKGISTGKTALETEETDFGTVSYGTILTQDSLDAIGIANSQMSAQELRELCLRYFKLQQSFLWTPDKNVECYPTGSPNLYESYMKLYAGQEDCVFDKNTGKALQVDTIYGGIPYQNVSTGNLYRWMEYYDESTGVMNLLDALVENGSYDNGAWMDKQHEYKRDASGNLLDKNGNLCSKTGLDPVLADEEFASTLYTVVYRKNSDKTLKLVEGENGLQYPVIDTLLYNSLRYFASQCSAGSAWAWSRVINSANFVWSAGATVANGFIPVGLYSYEYQYNGATYNMSTIDSLGSKTKGNPLGWATKDVAQYWINKTETAANQSKYGIGQSMYECYAKLQPADCVVDDGHIMMVKDVTVVRNADGSIDPKNSYITIYEQFNDAYGFYGSLDDGENSAKYVVHGGYVSDFDDTKSSYTQNNGDFGDRIFTFQYLLFEENADDKVTNIKNPYIPFTFAEFHYGVDTAESKAYIAFYENSVPSNVTSKRYAASDVKAVGVAAGKSLAKTGEKSFSGCRVEAGEVLSNLDSGATKLADSGKKSLTFKEYKSLLLVTNYPVSDVFVKVTDSEGKEVASRIYRALTPYTFSVDIDAVTAPDMGDLYTALEPLADGENTIQITVQLGSGEFITVFEGAFTK